jgi:hypothetical protein
MKNGLRQAQAPEQPVFVRIRIKTMRFSSPSPTGGGDFLLYVMMQCGATLAVAQKLALQVAQNMVWWN